MRIYDVGIVGGGPAGLFAALELVKLRSDLKIALFDKGGRVEERKCPIAFKTQDWWRKPLDSINCGSCSICHVLHGIGGAGTFSSGIVNLRPDVGGDLDKLLGSWEAAEELVKYVDNVLLEFGAPKDSLLVPDSKKARQIEKLAAKAGAKYIPTPQRILGTEVVVNIVSEITRYLEKSGVDIYSFTNVVAIDKTSGSFRLKTNRGDFQARRILLAPGRGGAEWLRHIAESIGLSVKSGVLDVGVRVEVPHYITEHVTSINYDPKIIMYTKTWDDMVRTFCTNPQGFVIKEYYSDGTIGVNGESYREIKSKNTNFALLVTLKLTNPYTDILELGKSIARMATKVGVGRPIIQRLGDLERGRRSTWERISRSTIAPTLRDSTPGDISLVLPHRVVSNILEAISRLDVIYPGLASPQTLIYAPEIKYYGVVVEVEKNMETSVEGVYVAGDGAGLSRGINIAAATGVLAARGIVSSL